MCSKRKPWCSLALLLGSIFLPLQVEILVVEGKADPHKRDRWGLTAAEEAERVGAHAVSMFLASQPTQEEVDHDGGPSC